MPYGDLVPLEIPSRNWELISMDFITDLPLSHEFDTLLIVVNCLSKQAHFIPTVKTLDAVSGEKELDLKHTTCGPPRGPSSCGGEGLIYLLLLLLLFVRVSP